MNRYINLLINASADNCGIGNGGFQPGNKCAIGDRALTKVPKELKQLMKEHKVKIVKSDRSDMHGNASYLRYQSTIIYNDKATNFDIIHEIGHAVDSIYGSEIPLKERTFDQHKYWSDSLKTVLATDLKTAKPKEIVSSYEDKYKAWEYAFSKPSEAFSHIFAAIKGDDTKVNGFSIKDSMPRTYKKVEKFLKSKGLA